MNRPTRRLWESRRSPPPGRTLPSASPATCASNLINEFRFNALWNLINLEAYFQGRDFNKDAGIRGLEETKRSFDIGSFPDFNWSGYTGLAGSSFDQRPKTQDRYTQEFVDNMTWIKGKHVVKFGTKIRLLLSGSAPIARTMRAVDVQRTEYGESGEHHADRRLVCRLGAGLPPNRRIAAIRRTPSAAITTAWHFFVQDDIKVSRPADAQPRLAL